MGCFLACYGISEKQRRRRFSTRVAAAGADYRQRSYVALDSSTLTLIENDESEQLRDKAKEAKKVRKKVTFNLNVQIFAPTLKDYEFVEEEADENKQEVAKRMASTTKSTGASTALTTSIGIFPSNHRYQNVRDSYDSFEEEEEYYAADEESDFDDDDYYGDGDYWDGDSSSDIDEPRMSQEVYVNQSVSSTINGESEWCAHSDLSPIENSSQWKAAKAKTVAPKQQKENVAPSFQEPNFLYSRTSCNQSKHLEQQIPVYASLSSWAK